MEPNLFFVHETVLQNKLQVGHLPLAIQPTDMISKVLSSSQLVFLREKLNVKDLHLRPLPPPQPLSSTTPLELRRAQQQ